jgi:large subunit ribosomal protein L19
MKHTSPELIQDIGTTGDRTVNVISEIEKSQLKEDIPQFSPGDTVRVHYRIIEGDKERIQIFEGVVIARQGKESATANFTVRRIAYNEGVERVFPLHSPRVEKVEIVREGRARRAKLLYLRDRSGKAARVKAKMFGGKTTQIAVADETAAEEVAPVETNETPAATEEAPPVEAEETEAAAEETEQEDK